MNQVPPADRYWTVDVLRGIAALAVALYHVSEVSLGTNNGFFSTLLHDAFRYGYLGIAVFFVISGFVIAASTTNGPITFRYFGKFILKRSIRLDPTYWSSIALDLVLTVIAIRLFAASTSLPDVQKVLLNMFYLQDLTGVGNIAAIYWTLCLEIQFYIVFCLVMAIDTNLSNRFAGNPRQADFKMWLFGGITLYSMAIAAQLLPTPLHGLFITHWMMFAMGAAAYHWGVRRRKNRWAFPTMMLGMFAVVAAQVEIKGPVYALGVGMACAMALLLYVGALQRKLGTWLKNDVLLYLGARSYSIYLFHAIVGERTAKLLLQSIYPKLGISTMSEAAALLAFAIGIAVSLAAAEIAYRLVEMPSLMLSKRIRPGRNGSPIKELTNGLAV
jgi:peptidoglycan/LPS O-acetylase OafA/YrhL